MVTGGARRAISAPALSVVLAALVTAPLWTASPALAGIVGSILGVSVLVVLAITVLAAVVPVAIEQSAAAVPAAGPAGTTRVLQAQFAAGVRGSRAPPLASA